MKRISNFILIALVGILVFAGCKKDGFVTFRATTQPYNGVEKMYIADNYSCWENGDQVKINSSTVTATVSTSSDGSYVELSGVEQASDYYAIYPASACAGTFGNNASITLPNVQTYRVENGNQVLTAPMAAMAYEERAGDGKRVLRFQNLCLILKVHIGQANNIIKAIKLVNPDSNSNPVPLSGTGTVTFTGTPAVPSLSMTSSQYNVTLNMASGVNLNVSGGTDFYIAVPALDDEVSFDIYTKDMLNQTRKLTVTTHQALHSNTIVKVDGPTQLDNNAYTFYDYIQSDSSGYINLRVKPKVGAKMELTYSLPTSAGVVASQYLCGSRSGGSTQWFTLTGTKGNNKGFTIYVGGSSVTLPGWTRQLNKKYRISSELVQDGGDIYSISIFQNLTDTLTQTLIAPRFTGSFPSNVPPVHLFAFNGTRAYKHACMRCYGFTYSENNVVLHDFVPCVKNATGEVGVYDMKEGEFIPPEQTGATAFSVGNDPVVPAP